MKLASLCMATVLALGGNAFAQTSTTPAPSGPAAPTSPNTPPAQTTPQSGDLTPGANSFTEAQARSWLEEAGYTDVSGLVQSEDGIWRGHAAATGQRSASASITRAPSARTEASPPTDKASVRNQFNPLGRIAS